jgi:hypothetical protein
MSLYFMLNAQTRTNIMATYEEQLAAMNQQQRDIDEQIKILQDKRQKLLEAAEDLKKNELKSNFGLSKRDTLELRRSLTILGETLVAKNVNYAEVTLVDDEPEQTNCGYSSARTDLYSFSMTCEYVNDFQMGFKYTVQIKTKSPAVRSIIQHMFRQEGPKEEEVLELRDRWTVNWGWNRAIHVVDPLDEETYFDMFNNSRRNT